MMFVFRNNTIEPFFPKDYQFSGYDDISFIPSEVDGYVWCYQMPVKFNRKKQAEEIRGYIRKIDYVLDRIDENKTFIVLTMERGYEVPFTEDDKQVYQAVEEYNSAIFEIECTHHNVKILDIKEFTENYSLSDIFDWKYFFLSQVGMSPKLSRNFSFWWSHKLDSIAFKRKKCLVLDLDNTIWGGVLGEDGIDGIKIGGDYPGKAFLFFQEALLQLSENGVILTICSKNNEQDVLDVWEKNPFIVLKKEHFAAYRINWNDKATNIQELAKELNIGLDSFVFVDDNPTERELIKQLLPMVSVPDFPTQPYELPLFFKKLVNDYFKVYSVTNEDKKKAEQYRANAARIRAEASFTDFRAFLESLDMRIIIEEANEFNIPRIAQMTQKTNQFNLTTKRYTEADVKSFVARKWKIWCISVADKFGDNGITGCIMITPDGVIDTFLLSCRILGKGIEMAFAKKVFSMLLDGGLTRLKAQYIPTLKNMQVAEFWDKCGFTCTNCNDGVKDYELNLGSADLQIEKYYNITVK